MNHSNQIYPPLIHMSDDFAWCFPTCKQASATAFVAVLYFDNMTQQSTLINRYTGGGSERGGIYDF